MFEFLRVLIIGLLYLFAGFGIAVIWLSFIGSMEIVYKAKILDSPPTPRWTRILNRIAWGMNGLMTVFLILTNRKQLFRTMLLMEAKETYPKGVESAGGRRYAPSTKGYAPMPGTILVFHANDEELGEPLYVLRPYQWLANDWAASIG